MKKDKNLWGGRFSGATNERFARFNRSFNIDARLIFADIRASIAHCEGLRAAGVLNSRESKKITEALLKLEAAISKNASLLESDDFEDVHSFIESKLVADIGELGKKLHTGRSRNDQVATAFRLWLREKIDELCDEIKELQGAFLSSAKTNFNAVMPGYTHLQRAQPILWAHWCLAYYEMLERDVERLRDTRRRVNVLPLGSAALAGNSFGIDRALVAKKLDFESVSQNSLDAVSDRDFAIEFVGDCALAMMHLSRFAEDLILYSTKEFGFVEPGDDVSTGSSLMPQKKNPDSLELIRGKSARVFGHHAALLSLMKGLPLAYNKDMQEDKEAVFDSFDTARESIAISRIVLESIKLDSKKMLAAATNGFLNATELADYLVRKGVAFRWSHEIVGKLVLFALKTSRELSDLSLSEMKKFSSVIEKDVYDTLSLEATLKNKRSIGGTAPAIVKKRLGELIRKHLVTKKKQG